MDRRNLSVVILAGGSNSRFWPLRSKSLLSFGGTTLLQQAIDRLWSLNVGPIVVVATPELEQQIGWMQQGLEARPRIAVQREPRGMGDALLAAAGALPELLDAPLAVTQAHDVVEQSLYQRFFDAAGAGDESLITAQRVQQYFPGGYLSIEGDSAAGGPRVTGLVEKPDPGTEPSDLVNIVLHLHRHPRELIDLIRAAYAEPTAADDHYERALAALLPRRRYNALIYDGRWQPIKYPWHVLGAMEVMLAELVPDAVVPEGVSGPVRLGSNVRLFPGARVVGPAWIGDNVVIGNNSLVRGSVIGRGVEIGYGCEIARSFIGDGCTFHHNYVGDSVIGERTSLGFGTVTGNWPFYPPPVRTDVGDGRIKTELEKFGAVIGADSRTGIGTLLSPGVKIGARTFIGPGVVVTRDVPDGRMILLKQETTDQPNPFR